MQVQGLPSAHSRSPSLNRGRASSCPPTRTTGTAFARALERANELGAFQLGWLKLSQIPPNRPAALARYALGSKAPLPKHTSRLSPLKHESLNVPGRYSFTPSQPFDDLRPLRDPDAAALDDDDDDGGNDE
ncbi:hypothetical protein OG520_42565 (plasmid) [Streptomyces sp. NBC_00984]|nr:hypothetical protein OG520_42565 [Streptomyces sp. NBC_00984]